MIRAITLTALVLLVGGCTLGPDYDRPEVPVPETFRGDGAAASGSTSFGDLEWTAVFQDPVLQVLLEKAVANNHDVLIAAERILEARAFVRIIRSELFPDLTAGPAYRWTRSTENGAVPLPPTVDPEQEEASFIGDLSWEIDFWGRVRRATEAARAELLGTELAREVVIHSLVAELALAYFDLLEFDTELEIARRTVTSRRRSLELVTLRLEQGVSNKVELRQSEGLVIDAERLVPEFEFLIQQQENLIRFLVGDNPGPVQRGLPLPEQALEADVPAGLPSALLERRPDVRAAEEELVAANARIGEAKALLFPAVRLTASGGVASEEFDDLLENGSRVWNVVPSMTQPLFNAGRLRNNLRAVESRQRQALTAYAQAVQQAFREVADALVARQKTEEVRHWRERLETTLQDQTALSNERYRGGVTSYLEVLDSERDYFDAELGLARSIRDELAAIVLLYRALGGGWQETAEATAEAADGS